MQMEPVSKPAPTVVSMPLKSPEAMAKNEPLKDNQRGVNSRFYTPGPFAPMESYARRFVDAYLATIGGKT